MLRLLTVFLASALLAGCTSPVAPAQDPTAGLEERKPSRAIKLPPASADQGLNESTVAHGRYLVGLLGCGTCHTQGALAGAPDANKVLAGSTIGIAISDPLAGNGHPGVIYPPNLTPDTDTGLGDWRVEEIVRFLKTGMDRHGAPAMTVMPWPTYAQLTDSDATAIAQYLRSIEPIKHKVPKAVQPGRPAAAPYVYFSVYAHKGQ